ncbi:hypothetical protein SVIO_048090 [Streptomyces violaceusniger]|uniref:Uncharacterized protein n=1 Tax=Streptomyces violaceusniger TaxID=68280 RepID=A0A4D4L4T7_STRVO|nr:hypothetical protein SVIO_048090 [Streptomyces violaceusniger]
MVGADGHPVHPQGVDDDPQDGEEAEERPLGGAGDGLVDGHPVREPGDQCGDDEPYGARVVGAHPHPAEQDEDGDEGKGGDEGGQGE